MTDDYPKYESECEAIREENRMLLDVFDNWLSARNLSAKTVRTHRENMDLYLNDFLLHDDPQRAVDGVAQANMFLGYWFIRKAVWSSAASIRSSAASLKKFYTFMLEMGGVSQEDLDELKADIKEGMPDWLDTVARYDDPDIDDPDEVWGF